MSAGLNLSRARLAAGGLVKICGLRQSEHAVAAALAGADLLGFIFADARRRVTPETARDCIAAARAASPDRVLLAVGVFVDATADEMNAVAACAGLDLIQIHGAPPPDLFASLARPALQVLRTGEGTVAEVERRIASHAIDPCRPLAYLVDGYAPHAHGGAGVRADWATAAHLAQTVPLILAGGLGPTNVADAIATVRPRGVDVSSGVETDGVKDPAKIAAFVAAAKRAFGAAPGVEA